MNVDEHFSMFSEIYFNTGVFILPLSYQVQCDDCDGWYHTDCVGCSYNKVKQSTAAFHCGCI